MLTSQDLLKLNRKMIGAKLRKAGAGYNKYDLPNCLALQSSKDLTKREQIILAKILFKYTNTQLKEYRIELIETLQVLTGKSSPKPIQTTCLQQSLF